MKFVVDFAPLFYFDSHISWSAGTSETFVKLDILRMIVAKFGSNWFRVSEKKIFEKVYRWTTMDRRQVMAIAHMAFWPGELKSSFTETMAILEIEKRYEKEPY